MKLPAEIKQKWLDALRSGEYKQGKGRLRDGNGAYCCLGVLQMRTDGDVEKSNIMVNSEMLPLQMPTPDYWIKIGAVDTESYPGLLASLNDGYNKDDEAVEPKSFAEIASFIEKEVGVV